MLEDPSKIDFNSRFPYWRGNAPIVYLDTAHISSVEIPGWSRHESEST